MQIALIFLLNLILTTYNNIREREENIYEKKTEIGILNNVFISVTTNNYFNIKNLTIFIVRFFYNLVAGEGLEPSTFGL